MNKLILLLLFFPLLVCTQVVDEHGLEEVDYFGSNPGHLRMFIHVPKQLQQPAPLVVVLHGCVQTPAGAAELTGWNKLADTHGFIVLYAEQRVVNNPDKCFNWFTVTNQTRFKGESFSIKQMADAVMRRFNIDDKRVFINGLSAGGVMTSIMLALYPDMFAAGAVFSGGPFMAATNIKDGLKALVGGVYKSDEDWGALVRAAHPTYKGSYPRVVVFHGDADIVVNKRNAEATVAQWTNVHHCNAEPDSVVVPYEGNNKVKCLMYLDSSGAEVVRYFELRGMNHAIATAAGDCPNQGGGGGMFAKEMGFYSVYEAARFFGVLRAPYTISGPAQVSAEQKSVVYEVPAHSGSSYQWQVPKQATIVSGQGGHQITVDFGTVAGSISVAETRSNGCREADAFLAVTLNR